MTQTAANERAFAHVLVNTAVANLTTSYLWFALTFWIYLETRSVLATGFVGGAYMLLLSVCSMAFGTYVDRHRKHRVMVVSAAITLVAFVASCAVYLAAGESRASDLGNPWFWFFAGVILIGAVVENMRNIALSTLVTLLIPEGRRANANGLVGTVQGIAFIVTSVFSGISVGQLGMGWTLAIATVLTAVALAHVVTIPIPEEEPEAVGNDAPAIDVRGAVHAMAAAPGLLALILFTTFNNLISGVHLALLDPYGLELFSVEMWGVVFGIAATGFIVGGLVVASVGLGRNPIRTMLILLMVMGLVGVLFTIREWAWLCVVGIWIYMALFPAVEAAEQTVIQRVVPFTSQGRVFGFAAAVESASGPVTALLVAPLAEFWVIPYMRSDAGHERWGWLLGEGVARGIALVFVVAGLVIIVVAMLAFTTNSYRRLTRQYTSGVSEVPGSNVA